MVIWRDLAEVEATTGWSRLLFSLLGRDRFGSVDRKRLASGRPARQFAGVALPKGIP